MSNFKPLNPFHNYLYYIFANKKDIMNSDKLDQLTIQSLKEIFNLPAK